MSQPSTSQRVVGLGRSGTLLQHSFAHPHLIFALHLPPRPFHHFSLNLVYLCPQRATMHDRAGEEFWGGMDLSHLYLSPKFLISNFTPQP